MKRLNSKRAAALRRIKEQGPDAWAGDKLTVGGSIKRMFESMAVEGLVSHGGPPFEITPAGEQALAGHKPARTPEP